MTHPDSHSHSPSSSSPTHSPVFTQNLLEASCVLESTKAALLGTFTGALVASGESWWYGKTMGEYGRTLLARAPLFGGMGAFLVGSACSLAHFREKDDAFNVPIAGALTGAFLGLRAKSFARMTLHSTVLGLSLFAIEYSQRNLSRDKSAPTKVLHDDKFFKYGPRDPFKSRMEALKQQQE